MLHNSQTGVVIAEALMKNSATKKFLIRFANDAPAEGRKLKKGVVVLLNAPENKRCRQVREIRKRRSEEELALGAEITEEFLR